MVYDLAILYYQKETVKTTSIAFIENIPARNLLTYKNISRIDQY